MVKVRLSRAGSKKRPYYHIVVTDHQSKRDGRYIERIGAFDPAKPEAEATLKRERLDYWLSVGAQMTTRTRQLVNRWQRGHEAALTGN